MMTRTELTAELQDLKVFTPDMSQSEYIDAVIFHQQIQSVDIRTALSPSAREYMTPSLIEACIFYGLLIDNG